MKPAEDVLEVPGVMDAMGGAVVLAEITNRYWRTLRSRGMSSDLAGELALQFGSMGAAEYWGGDGLVDLDEDDDGE